MLQPCSPALPPGQSLPQVVGWSVPVDAVARDATEPKDAERSAVITCEGETPNLQAPPTVMSDPRSRPRARQPTHRSCTHQRVCSTTA
ncbi:xanthomonadin biosynthesis protein [Xanthomonas vesicatoria ATCC 35937]|nr:xanthomonadin biosynthesis protein [Xanthomonas vesicatoria ATCC 35937]